MAKLKTEEISQALAADILNLCYGLDLQGKIEHNDFVAYNPTRNDKHLGSFRICIRGAKQGIWAEFASGERGDALDLINYCLFGGQSNMYEAICWAKSFLGLENSAASMKKIKQRAVEQRTKAEQEQSEQADKYRRYAQKIFLSAEEKIKGTPAEEYFKARGIDFQKLGKQPHCMRFQPKCFYSHDVYMPALVTAIHNLKGEFVAVHRTYLEQVDGVWRRKCKKVLGSFAGGAIRLWRGKSGLPIYKLAAVASPDEVDGTVIICEGIEDGLSIALACPQYRIWTAISVSNMQNIELPDCIHQVIIAMDQDGEGSAAYYQVQNACEAFLRAGKVVKLAKPPRAHDFNDELTGKNYKQS